MLLTRSQAGLASGSSMVLTLRIPVRATAGTCVRHPPHRCPVKCSRKPATKALAWSTTSGNTALPWLERRARLALLERERDDAVQLAQVCAKRSQRLLARVEKLQEYAEQRRAAADDAAVEATLKTQAQVHAILAKTINRAHNNYALAARLEDLIGLIQQQLLISPQKPGDLQQALSQIAGTAAAGTAETEADSENDEGDIGRPVRLLNGSVQEDEAAPYEPQQPAIQAGTQEELARAQSVPGHGAWTSMTLGSMSEIADWGMASIDWASLVDPALASALTGHGPSSSEDTGTSTDAQATDEGGERANDQSEKQQNAAQQEKLQGAGPPEQHDDAVMGSVATSASDEDRPRNRVRPARDDGSIFGSEPGGVPADTAGPTYTEEPHSALAADTVGSTVVGEDLRKQAGEACSEGGEGNREQQVDGPEGGRGLTEEALRDHDRLARELFGNAPAEVSDEWLQQAQAAAAAAAVAGQPAEDAPAAGALDSACGSAEECESADLSRPVMATDSGTAQAAPSDAGEHEQPAAAPGTAAEVGLVVQAKWQQAVRKAVQAAAEGGQEKKDVLTNLDDAIEALRRQLSGSGSEFGH